MTPNRNVRFHSRLPHIGIEAIVEPSASVIPNKFRFGQQKFSWQQRSQLFLQLDSQALLHRLRQYPMLVKEAWDR